jgi:hypothetical protein
MTVTVASIAVYDIFYFDSTGTLTLTTGQHDS